MQEDGDNLNLAAAGESTPKQPWATAQDFDAKLMRAFYAQGENGFQALIDITPEAPVGMQNLIQRAEAENGLTRDEYIRLTRFLLELLKEDQRRIAVTIISSFINNPESFYSQESTESQTKDD